MNPAQYKEIQARFAEHTVKSLPDQYFEVQNFFVYKPGTTVDAMNLVVSMGRIYMAGTDVGGLVLQPFAPDALIWLKRNIHDPGRVFAAIPPNLQTSATRVDMGKFGQLLSLMNSLIQGVPEEDEEIYRDSMADLVNHFSEFWEYSDPLPYPVYLEAMMASPFYVDGLLDEEDFLIPLDYDHNCYVFLAALERFIEVLEHKLSEEDLPWSGYERPADPEDDEDDLDDLDDLEWAA